MPTVLIDADGCPVVDLAIRLCKGREIPVLILCDTAHRIERPGAETLVFDKGADSVDFALVNRAHPGDIVITQDYGLASMCLARRARVPLASGLLTGRYTKDTVFGKEDHRSYNRNGEAFDKGETFSGVDYELGLQAVEELKKLFHTENLIPYALRWILMHDAVSAVIPGASKQEQVLSNVRAARMPSLTQEEMDGVSAIYDRYIKESVHENW